MHPSSFLSYFKIFWKVKRFVFVLVYFKSFQFNFYFIELHLALVFLIDSLYYLYLFIKYLIHILICFNSFYIVFFILVSFKYCSASFITQFWIISPTLHWFSTAWGELLCSFGVYASMHFKRSVVTWNCYTHILYSSHHN